MKDKKKYIGSIIFFVLMLVFTGYLVFKDNSIGDIIRVFIGTNKTYIYIAMSMMCIFLGMQGLYLKVIFKYLGEKIKFFKGFIYACIEFYFSGITPSSTGGQPAEMYYMRKDGIPVGKSSIAVLLVTAIFKLVIIVLGIVALIFKSSLILNNGTTFNIIFFFGIAANLALLFGCMFLMFSKGFVQKWTTKFIKLLGKLRITKNPEKIIARFEKHLEEYRLGAKYVKENIKLSVIVTLITIVQRIALFSVGYFVYKSMGLSGYSYFDIMFIQVAVALAIDSLPFPGGMGISEVMLLLIYEKIFGGDIVVPAMLLTRCISYYFCLILSGIVTMINHIRTNIIEKNKETNKEKIKEEVQEELSEEQKKEEEI